MRQERPIRRKPELDKATLFQEQRELAKVRNRGEYNEADEERSSHILNDRHLMNLQGVVVARGHAAHVAVKNLAPGAYVVRPGVRIQKIELK